MATLTNEQSQRRSLTTWLLKKLFVAPFRWMWRFASQVEKRIGIFFTLLSGALMVLVGFWLASSFIGFPIGFPMLLIGTLLVLRALY